jgi:hypothetical protein
VGHEQLYSYGILGRDHASRCNIHGVRLINCVHGYSARDRTDALLNIARENIMSHSRAHTRALLIVSTLGRFTTSGGATQFRFKELMRQSAEYRTGALIAMKAVARHDKALPLADPVPRHPSEEE